MRLQRKVRAAQSRVPGESRGGGRESVDSPDWRGGPAAREQQRPGPGGLADRVKRAILPAAISEPADNDGGSPRPKVESSREGDDVAGPARGPREMTITNRTRLTRSPRSMPPMVPLAQSAERRSVEPEVTGSSPVRHPPWRPAHVRGPFLST